MIASDVTITDSDWHDIYDRTDYVALPKEVIIEENVWIGEKSLILKGSKIGKNSIIGAGSVVRVKFQLMWFLLETLQRK